METKVCNKCAKEKEISSFGWIKSNNAYQGICKECRSSRARSDYQSNPKIKIGMIERQQQRILDNRKFLYELLCKSSCVDCGDSRWEVLEFDHVRGAKRNNISYMVGHNYSLKEIKKEISKCEIRCANCHRLKTAKQFSFYQDIGAVFSP